jgi:ketosteroid isomerase-like protein
VLTLRLGRRGLLIGTLLLGACATPRAFAPADRAEVIAVLERQREAWNRGDLDGYLAGYEPSPALIFTSGGKIRRGLVATRAAYQRRYGRDRSGMGRLGFEILEVQALGADGAVVLGRWALTDTPAAGRGVFSVVLARTPAGWRIVHDHTSADPPPPVPAPPAPAPTPGAPRS